MRAMLLLVLCWSMPALAIPTTYLFTGTVKAAYLGANPIDPSTPYVDGGATVLNGDIAVSGSFTFDFDTVPINSGGTVPGGMMDWSLSTQGQTFAKRTDPTLQFVGLDADSLNYTDEIPLAELGPDVFTLDLDFAGDPLASSFLGGEFGFFLMDHGLSGLTGSIDSLVTVPEPPPAWLLALGLFGLLFARGAQTLQPVSLYRRGIAVRG